MEKKQALNKLAFYHDAKHSLKTEIAASAMVAHLEHGDYYFHEGDVCSNIAIVIGGRIRVFKMGENGRSITLYHVSPGETCILTTFCLLSQDSYQASAQAEEPTTAIIFPAGVFREWMNEHAAVRAFVFATMSDRLSEMMALIEEITFKKLDQRLVEFIISSVDGASASLNLTHEEIASQIGTAREVVSRVLKEFERRGALELQRGKIIIKDLALLRNWPR